VDSEQLINRVLDDAPAHEITDAIKDLLYAKSANKVEGERPAAVADLFKSDEVEPEEPTVDQEEEPENVN
jgi:uncharacterized protein (UPF0262 family)|tara:strand:+ start:827 stop:1036 length:210 start_codon:yes stop_codon:yes gene_type:complete